MAKAQLNAKKQAPTKKSKPLEKQGKSAAKKEILKKSSTQSGSGAKTGSLQKAAGKSLPKALVKQPTKMPGAASKTKSNEKAVAKPSGKALSKPAAKPEPKESPKAVVKPAMKGKAKKKVEAEDDLLIGEADGSDESIEGLDEIEELETEILETAEVVSEALDTLDESEALATPPTEESEEIILTDAEGRRLCQVRDCDQAASVELYCRFHYLQNWKRIQVRRKILADGKLERYVDELTSRYPDKFLEMIRKDLRSEKDFLGAIAELEIDESGLDNDFEDESQSFIEEVRGVTETGLAEEEEF